jgi:molybdopterin converting factor small subunit
MLAEAVGTDAAHAVTGSTVAEALEDLFADCPGLRGHIYDEAGAIRPHVAVFVDGYRAGSDTAVSKDAEVYVLHAVSGG